MKPCKYTMQPRRRWMFLPVVFGVILMFVVAVLLFLGATVHMVSEVRPNPRDIPATPMPAPPVSEDGAPATADLFLADAYPSRASALRAMSSHVVDAIGDVTPSGTPERVVIRTDPLELPGVMLQQTISRALPDARIEFVDHDTDAAVSAQPNTAIVRVDEKLHPGNTEKGSKHARESGTIQLKVEGPHQSKVLTTTFADHRWADDLPGWSNENPNHQWIIGRSTRPTTSAAQARQEAEQDAARQLDDYLRAQLRAMPFARDGRHIDRAIAIARPGRLAIADRFGQRIHRPYGDIWSEAVLVDVHPELVQNAVGEYQVLARHQDMRVRATIGSVAIVLFTILLAYVLLNTITLRYFTGRLRLAAIFCSLVVLAIAAVAVLNV